MRDDIYNQQYTQHELSIYLSIYLSSYIKKSYLYGTALFLSGALDVFWGRSYKTKRLLYESSD